MIANSVIQADLIADALADSNITDRLNTANEVREDQYQGREFGYPAVRLAVQRQTPMLGPEPCDLAMLTFSFRCYTEVGSSRTADELAAAINDRYHRRFFSAGSWYSWLRSSGLVSAVRISDHLWRAEAFFTGIVYPR